MKISAKGIALIKSFEGLVLKAYRDIVGVLTIGYGHTLGVKPGDVITREKADEYLAADVAYFEKKLNRFLDQAGIKLTQNQYDALISFIFNVGWGAFAKSTMLKKLYLLDQSDRQSVFDVADQFKRWVYAGGKPVQGLINRREAERKLFLAE